MSDFRLDTENAQQYLDTTNQQSVMYDLILLLKWEDEDRAQWWEHLLSRYKAVASITNITHTHTHLQDHIGIEESLREDGL